MKHLVNLRQVALNTAKYLGGTQEVTLIRPWSPEVLQKILEEGRRSKQSMASHIIMGGFMKAENVSVIDALRQAGVRAVRGQEEDMILQLLHAADTQDQTRMRSFATVMASRKGGYLLQVFAQAQGGVVKATEGRVADARNILPALIDGSLRAADVRPVFEGIFGQETLRWLESLPAVLLIPSSWNPKKCRYAMIISHGSLDQRVDLRMLTEEAFIWGDSDQPIKSIESPSLLYAIFEEETPVDCIQVQTNHVPDPKTGQHSPVESYYSSPSVSHRGIWVHYHSRNHDATQAIVHLAPARRWRFGEEVERPVVVQALEEAYGQ